MKPTIKTYVISKGDRVLTLAAVQHTVVIEGKPIGSRVTVGFSVRDPKDTDEVLEKLKVPKDLGETIAIGRAETKPCLMVVAKPSRLSKGFLENLMDNLAKEIELNFCAFIPLGNNKGKTVSGGKRNELRPVEKGPVKHEPMGTGRTGENSKK